MGATPMRDESDTTGERLVCTGGGGGGTDHGAFVWLYCLMYSLSTWLYCHTRSRGSERTEVRQLGVPSKRPSVLVSGATATRALD